MGVCFGCVCGVSAARVCSACEVCGHMCTADCTCRLCRHVHVWYTCVDMCVYMYCVLCVVYYELCSVDICAVYILWVLCCAPYTMFMCVVRVLGCVKCVLCLCICIMCCECFVCTSVV